MLIADADAIYPPFWETLGSPQNAVL